MKCEIPRMKFLEVSQLKAKSETPIKILEDNLNITNKSIHVLKNDLDLFIDDLEKLREGLIYKHEEIQKEMQKKTPAKIIDEFNEFEEKFTNINAHELPQIKNILSMHAEIGELKNELRIITIVHELKKGNNSALEKLIENPHEWQFLALFFCQVLDNENFSDNYSEKSSTKDLFGTVRSYKHKLEEKIYADFQVMLDTKDFNGVKNCYAALKLISKHKPLVDAYIQSLSLYEVVKKEKPKFDSVDLDLFLNENNSFIKYLKEIERLYIDIQSEIKNMFDKPDNIIDKLNKYIFVDVLPQHLEFCIESNEPVLFLLNLEFFAKNTKLLLRNISQTNENLDIKEVYDELFEVYMTEILFKEKECFDYLFEIVVKKKKTKTRYLYKSIELYIHEFKPFNEITMLIRITLAILKRAAVLEYDHETTDSINKHIFRKLNQFTDTVCSSFQGVDRFELIKILSDIYLMVKNYLSTNAHFADFQDNINEKLQSNYEIKIKESKLHIKNMTKTLNFKETISDNTKMMSLLLIFLKREVQIVDLNIKGKNGLKYMVELFNFLFDRIYKQYFGIVYNKNDSLYALNDIRVITKFVKENQFIEVYSRFEYLMELIEFVAVQKIDLMLYYKSMSTKIPEKDLKHILKCRPDYKDVKKLFG